MKKSFCDICENEIKYKPNKISIENFSFGMKDIILEDICDKCLEDILKFITELRGEEIVTNK